MKIFCSVFFFLSAFLSVSTLQAEPSDADFSAEVCQMKISTKDSQWFKTRYEAQKYCDNYGALGCRVYNPEAGRWNSQIDFSEVFKSENDDFKAARTETYRSYFNSIESRGLYKTPFSFSVVFNCKSKY